jgi:hypothetical protein
MRWIASLALALVVAPLGVLLGGAGCSPSLPDEEDFLWNDGSAPRRRDAQTAKDDPQVNETIEKEEPLEDGGSDAHVEPEGCGGEDSECSSEDYGKACTGGKCMTADCCCELSRQCRAGSFGFCCPSGTTCSADGTCT